MGKTRVLLALEPRMLRQLLRRAIATDPRLRVVGEVIGGGAEDIVAAARGTRPHVAVLTLGSPDEVPPVGRRLLAERLALVLLLLSDRVAGGLLCQGNPPRCRGLTLHSTGQILQAIRDARSGA
jgi:DNA-binding NarL/FixJ family response regulator